MRSLLKILSVRYWRRCPARLLLVVASIALGVAAWVATRALSTHLNQSSRASATLLAGFADLLVSNGDAGVPRSLIEPLRQLAGVHAVRPVIVQRVLLPDFNRQTALLLGADLQDKSNDPAAWDVTIRLAAPQAFLETLFGEQRVALVGRELDGLLPSDAGSFNVLVGGRMTSITRAGTILQARGPAALLAGTVLLMPCAEAAALLGRPDLVSRLDLQLEPDADRDTVRRQVETIVLATAQVSSPEAKEQWIEGMLAPLTLGLALCGLGALLVGLFLIYNTLAVSVVERRREIGILHALGATRGQIFRLFLGEALCLGSLGTLLGMPLGIGLAKLSLGSMQRVLSDVLLPLPGTAFQVTMDTWFESLLAGLGTTLLATLAPALQAAGEAPIRALRRLPARASGVLRWCRCGGIPALAVASLLCVACKDSLPLRVGTFGGLLLSIMVALLAMPCLAAMAARLLHRLAASCPGIGARLAMDNIVSSPGRTGLVTAALAASVALLVLTGGLIQSNEAAVRSWVDDSIGGDLFITAGGPLSASGKTFPMEEDTGRQLRALLPEAVVAAARFRYLDYTQSGRTDRVLLTALDPAILYTANKDRQPPFPGLELYRQLAVEADTALVSENFAALHRVGIGDTITLPGADGPALLRVVGTVVDFSCPHGTVYVDRIRNRRTFNAHLVDALGVYLPPGADVEASRLRVQQAPWAAGQLLCVMTRRELRAHILGMVERLYGLAYTQELMVGIVAVLGVVAALLISVLYRRRELGLLRAVGATRVQVMRSVLAEALLLSAIGTGLGLVAGLPLEWYTLRILLFEEAGFHFPILYPWPAFAAVTGVALVSAMVAGIGPALHAVRPCIALALSNDC
jgi:putative ABC transport system permease protein